MDDLYCPACRLVPYWRAVTQVTARHCPRCIALTRRLVALLALDMSPPDRFVGNERPPETDTVPTARQKWWATDQQERSRYGPSGIATP